MTVHTLYKYKDSDPDLIKLDGDLLLDPQITCNIQFDTKESNTFNKSILVKTKSFVDYEFNETSQQLESRIMESGARDAGYMII